MKSHIIDASLHAKLYNTMAYYKRECEPRKYFRKKLKFTKLQLTSWKWQLCCMSCFVTLQFSGWQASLLKERKLC